MAKKVNIEKIKDNLEKELLSLLKPFIEQEVKSELSQKNRDTFTEMETNGCTIANNLQPFGRVDLGNDMLILNEGNRFVELFSSSFEEGSKDDGGNNYYLLETRDNRVFFVKVGSKTIGLINALPSSVIRRFAKNLLWCCGTDRLLRYAENPEEYRG